MAVMPEPLGAAVMNSAIRSTHAALVILDISGYTRVIHQRLVSLEHAEAIITELMEAIIDQAAFPLQVNKLEGDAALLYAETGKNTAFAMHSVYAQVTHFFAAFKQRAQAIREARKHCGCDACANVDTLKLKAIIHVGDIVVKRVRQFEEIAGDAVILLHRLLKNDVPSHEYLLLTAAARSLLSDTAEKFVGFSQRVEGMDACAVYWSEIADLLGAAIPTQVAPAIGSQQLALPKRLAKFRHLPLTYLDRIVQWWRLRSFRAR
jgi:hypothetical protein